MKYRVMGIFAVGALMSASLPVLAHHGTSVTYDTSKEITVTGTVTEFVYGYPHSQIYFDVKDDSGTVAHWGTELGPTPTMMKNLKVGWNRDSIRAGDNIELTCHPHRVVGSTACLSRRIVINGKLMPVNAEQVREAAAS